MLTKLTPSILEEIRGSYLIPSLWDRSELKRPGFRGYTYNAVDLTAFNKVQTGINISWDVLKAVGTVPNANENQGIGTTAVGWTFGTTSGEYCNQIVRGLLTITSSGTNNFVMSTCTIPNVIGTSSPTFSKVKEMIVELLSAGQLTDAGAAGNAASSVSLGNGAGAGQAWPGPFGNTGVYTLNNGDKWHHVASEGGGVAVTAGDNLKILNNDGALSAYVRITILGLA